MNDTVGPDGLVPSMLVFGTMPRFPPIRTDLPNHEERLRAMHAARTEMANIVAQHKVQLALRARVPPAASFLVRPNDRIYVHDEVRKKWIGPYTVLKTFEKQVWIDRHDGQKQYSLDHCLPVKEADAMSLVHHVHTALNQFATGDDDSDSLIYLNEILQPGDPREQSPEFQKAIRIEIQGLIDNKVFEVVDKNTVPLGANIFGGRFVLSIKNKHTPDEKEKARFVAQGHRDKEKDRLIHPTTTLRHRSVRIIVALAVMYQMDLWTQDISQAYLQSEDKLSRDVYLRPTPHFNLSAESLMHLLKSIYGLTDAGDYWGITITRFAKDDMQMTPTTLDISLFFKVVLDKLCGLSGFFVDDGIHSGTEEFSEESRKIEQKFKATPRETNKFKFAGVQVDRDGDHAFIHQQEYSSHIKPLPTDATFIEFRSSRQKLMWLCNTRPDIACATNKLTQITEQTYGNQAIKDLNKVVHYIQRTPMRGLHYPKLDLDSLQLRAYADSSFANNADSTTQLGFIVILTDSAERANVIHYTSRKSRRVVRSCLGGETYALADALDICMALKHDLEEMLRQPLPLMLFTDIKSLFDVITKNTVTTETRLMVAVRALRESYERMEIGNVGWIRSEWNPADALTKVRENQVLNKLLDKGVISHPTEQWVIRKTTVSSS